MTHRFEDDELASAIARVSAPRSRDAFRSGLRSALLEAAANEWSERGYPAPDRPALAFAWRVVLAGLVVFAMGSGATGAAAATSLPGDAVYPVKLALENVELSFARNDVAKVEVLARQADRRLDELNTVWTTRPESLPSANASYQSTVQRFQAAVDALKSAAAGANDKDKQDEALDVAEAAADKHVGVLEDIRSRSNGPAIEKSLEQAKELEKSTKDRDRRVDDKKDQKKSDPDKDKQDLKKDDKRDGDQGVAPPENRPAARPTPTPRAVSTPRATPTQKTDRSDD